MTELERWMNDHPPLADALTAEETAALRQKVLARRPKPRVLRGWRLAAAAAALCLVAAGAVVLGLDQPEVVPTSVNAVAPRDISPGSTDGAVLTLPTGETYVAKGDTFVSPDLYAKVEGYIRQNATLMIRESIGGLSDPPVGVPGLALWRQWKRHPSFH